MPYLALPRPYRCDEECAAASTHREECPILARADKPDFEAEGDTEAYHCLLPLRLLLLTRSQPKVAALALRHLMDHEEERKGGEDWLTTERTVVARLCGAGEGFSEAEVRRALGVLEVNCYEVTCTHGAGTKTGVRGCFPLGSLLSHSCVTNSRHLFSEVPPYTNTCIATVDLEEGQEVLTSYQQPHMCSLRSRSFCPHNTLIPCRRRPELSSGWYFSCRCPRCLSATELGSHLNSLVV